MTVIAKQIIPLLTRRAVAAWTPASLTGLAATLLPAESRSRGLLWQNTAKTMPATADGDPVRVAICPYTAVEFTAPSDSARPLLYDESGGLWSLEFDGVDDYLEAGNLSALFSAAGSASYRFNVTSIAASFEILNTNLMDASNTSFARFVGDGNSYPGQLRSTRVQSQPGIGTGGRTLTVRSDASNWTRRNNGTQDVAATPLTANAGGFAGGTLWRVGCSNGAGTNNPALFFSGRFSGLITAAQYWDATTVAVVETFLGAL